MVCLQVDQLVAACAELAKMTSSNDEQQCLSSIDQPGEHEVEEVAAVGDCSDDGLDLYGDLQQAFTAVPANHVVIQQLQEQVQQLQTMVANHESHIEDLQQQLAEKDEQVQTLSSQRLVLLTNISSLFKTAQAEIKRQAGQLTTARLELSTCQSELARSAKKGLQGKQHKPQGKAAAPPGSGGGSSRQQQPCPRTAAVAAKQHQQEPSTACRRQQPPLAGQQETQPMLHTMGSGTKQQQQQQQRQQCEPKPTNSKRPRSPSNSELWESEDMPPHLQQHRRPRCDDQPHVQKQRQHGHQRLQQGRALQEQDGTKQQQQLSSARHLSRSDIVCRDAKQQDSPANNASSQRCGLPHTEGRRAQHHDRSEFSAAGRAAHHAGRSSSRDPLTSADQQQSGWRGVDQRAQSDQGSWGSGASRGREVGRAGYSTREQRQQR